MQCPLCREESANWPPPISFTFEVECSNCGNFRIIHQAREALRDQPETAFLLGSWVYMQTQMGTAPLIDEPTVEWFKTAPRPSTQRRAELYLGRVIGLAGHKLNGIIRPDHSALRVASWSFDRVDAIALADYLSLLGAFDQGMQGPNRRLIAKAHILFEEWASSRASSSQAFVAMWFDPLMVAAYDQGFSKAISGSGYDALRVDRKEYDGKIDDQIIAEIRRSAFVVADFTGHRTGVYYEAGFAHGLGRKVIFTCKRDQVKDLHFDVRQYNTILWDSPAEIVALLQNRILALFGAGPRRPEAKPIPIAPT